MTVKARRSPCCDTTPPPETGRADGLAYEETPQGRQALAPGVAPLTLHDHLALRLAAPAAPRRYQGLQKPCDIGLFDQVARSQTDLVDLVRAAERAELAPTDPSPKPKE